MERGYAADTRAQREQQHHAEIRQRLVEYFLIPRMEVGAQRLRSAAHIANAVVSFVCAMQVQTFRKVRGHAYASTMCIGNMRSGTEALCAYFHTRDKEILRKALTYFGVVLLFALGAGIGSIATLHWGAGTIWLSCGLLTVSFLIMFVHDEEEKLNA